MPHDNLHQILTLSQRGGRPLSLVDLIEANTVDLEVAATLAGAVSAGASFLTAARPGNAGKSTLLAALAAFVPAERPIVTVENAGALQRLPDECCLLAHEIGSAPIHSYLWGGDARCYFEAIRPGVTAASCIHADTLEELNGVLCGRQIGLAPEAFARIGLVAFLRLDETPAGYRRRVSSVYAAGSEGHQRVFGWEEATDTFYGDAPAGRWEEAIARARELFQRLCADGTHEFEDVFAAAKEALA